MKSAQTVATLEDAVEVIGEKLAHGEIHTGEAVRTAMIDIMTRYNVVTIGPVRVALRRYLGKYDASQLPKNEALTIVLRRD